MHRDLILMSIRHQPRTTTFEARLAYYLVLAVVGETAETDGGMGDAVAIAVESGRGIGWCGFVEG